MLSLGNSVDIIQVKVHKILKKKKIFDILKEKID